MFEQYNSDQKFKFILDGSREAAPGPQTQLSMRPKILHNNFGTFSTGALASNEEPFDEVVEIRVCVSVCVCGPAKSNLVDGGFDAEVDFDTFVPSAAKDGGNKPVLNLF